MCSRRVCRSSETVRTGRRLVRRISPFRRRRGECALAGLPRRPWPAGDPLGDAARPARRLNRLTADGVAGGLSLDVSFDESVPVPRDESAPLSLDRRSDGAWAVARRRWATQHALPGIAAAVPDAASPSAGPAIGGFTGAQQPPSGDPGPLYTPYGSPDAMTAARPLEQGSNVERWLVDDEPWTWQAPADRPDVQILPGRRAGAAVRHPVRPRTHQGWVWDSTLGARVGVLRDGTDNDLWPEGWQLDVEGAAFPRLSLDPIAS